MHLCKLANIQNVHLYNIQSLIMTEYCKVNRANDIKMKI